MRERVKPSSPQRPNGLKGRPSTRSASVGAHTLWVISFYFENRVVVYAADNGATLEYFSAGWGNVAYIEELYEAYLQDPNAVTEEWRLFFDQLPRVSDSATAETPHQPIREQFYCWLKSTSCASSPTSGGIFRTRTQTN